VALPDHGAAAHAHRHRVRLVPGLVRRDHGYFGGDRTGDAPGGGEPDGDVETRRHPHRGEFSLGGMDAPRHDRGPGAEHDLPRTVALAAPRALLSRDLSQGDHRTGLAAQPGGPPVATMARRWKWSTAFSRTS